MQAPGQTVHRIADIDAQVGEGRLFGQHSASNRPSAPEYRGVAEADIVTKNGQGPDFDEEGDPRSSELFAQQTNDQDEIGRESCRERECQDVKISEGTETI